MKEPKEQIKSNQKAFQKKQNILKVHASSPILGNQLICNMFG